MPGELPVRLARCIRKLAPQTEWRAYTDDARIFFAIARRPETQGHNEAVVTMDVYFLDRNAAVFSAGKWAHTPEHGWWLDAIVPPSYDPQNGWWLDAVMLNAEGSLGSRAPPCRIVR